MCEKACGKFSSCMYIEYFFAMASKDINYKKFYEFQRFYSILVYSCKDQFFPEANALGCFSFLVNCKSLQKKKFDKIQSVKL